MEVWDKTCRITALILAVVREEAKDGPIGTNGFAGQTTVAQGREVLFCSCINFYSLRKSKISWPLALKNLQ